MQCPGLHTQHSGCGWWGKGEHKCVWGVQVCACFMLLFYFWRSVCKSEFYESWCLTENAIGASFLIDQYVTNLQLLDLIFSVCSVFW